ncbi:MAG: helix-turn-helix domain-containing protein [Oscillospiraceae bacterium]|jgi:transcriptional regulator with XRE-family HTH domain|nr:helix-turn-helix domain-containing protein [Oscillospiraceae bacterium]
MEQVLLMARRIREMREICGFSREMAASNLGISVNQYAAFEENGEDIPISVLYRAAQLFRVDLTELMSGKAPHLSTYCHVKKGTGLSIDRYPGYNFQSLANTYKNRVMEPILVTVEPSEKTPALVTHGGQEFNMCLEGVIDLLFENKTIRLEPGDSVYFNPALPHGEVAVGGPAQFLTVITREVQ